MLKTEGRQKGRQKGRQILTTFLTMFLTMLQKKQTNCIFSFGKFAN